MSIEIRIVDGPVATAGTRPPGDCVGAVLVFEGIVRRLEDGRVIDGLLYEHYEGMAEQEMRRIADEVAREFGLHAIRVWHSTGLVPVGRCSFRLEVESAHRAEAIRGLASFIDRLKREVPIWKRAAPPVAR